MKLPRLKTIVLTPLVLFVLLYIIAAIAFSQREVPVVAAVESPVTPLEIAIFGASGTAGDGILKAALASQDIATIHVITRRETPRIAQGVASGKVRMTIHKDYLDYSAVLQQLAEVDAVYWAIGLSSLGVDEQTYSMIHVDFPMQFVAQWTAVSNKADPSFHYISSSDISDDSTAMWARQKVRAEKSLFSFADGTNLRVIAYRPDYIGPTTEQAHIGQNLLYWFFKPVGAAVRATQIGRAMIAVTLRGAEFSNGSKLSTSRIVQYSDAYPVTAETGG